MKKKLFKKNQIIITALAVMIAVAGYINYSDSRLNKQSEETAETQEAAEGTIKETADISDITEEIESLDYDLTDEIAEAAENPSAQSTKSGEDEDGDEIGTETGDEIENTDGEEGGLEEMDTEETDEEETDTGEMDAEETDAEDVSAGTPGEAVLTGASTYAAQARISREQVRSQNKETLLEIINNEELSQEEKQNAVDSMVSMADSIEREAAAESMLEAKGFDSVVVSISEDSADVMVPTSELDASQLAQIEDVVKRKTGVEAQNIVITPMDESVAE